MVQIIHFISLKRKINVSNQVYNLVHLVTKNLYFEYKKTNIVVSELNVHNKRIFDSFLLLEISF